MFQDACRKISPPSKDAYHNTCRPQPQTAVAFKDDAAQLTASAHGRAGRCWHAQLFVSGREVCITLVNRAIRPRLVRLEQSGSSSGCAAARPISCAGIPAHQVEPLATRPHFKNLAALGHLLSFSLFPFLTPLCFRLFIQGRACFASRRTCQSKHTFLPTKLVIKTPSVFRTYLIFFPRPPHAHPPHTLSA